MAFALPLSPPLPKQGWKVKIRDRERLEPPHVTIIRGTQTWRFSLRSGEFLDDDPDPREVPENLLSEIYQDLERLRFEWDQMYPENPVQAKEDDDD